MIANIIYFSLICCRFPNWPCDQTFAEKFEARHVLKISEIPENLSDISLDILQKSKIQKFLKTFHL